MKLSRSKQLPALQICLLLSLLFAVTLSTVSCSSSTDNAEQERPDAVANNGITSPSTDGEQASGEQPEAKPKKGATKPQNSQRSKVEIRKAVFGSGKSAIVCTERIQALVDARKSVKINSGKAHLNLRNPRGAWRRKIKIDYRVGDQKGSVSLKNGQTVNFHDVIVRHAEKFKPRNKNNPDKEAVREQTVETTEPLDTTIELPGGIDQMATGGSGRFLIAHIKKTNSLNVIDLVKKKVVKQISVPEKCCFAAGESKLLIAIAKQNLLQRWDLKTLKKEKTVQLDRDYPPTRAVMGSSGSGPLVLWYDGKIQLWDVDKLEKIEVEDNGNWPGGEKCHNLAMAISADGHTFTYWDTGYGPLHIGVASFQGGEATIARSKSAHSRNHCWIIPNASGSQFFQYDGTVLTADFREIPGNRGTIFLPTQDPSFCLKINKHEKQRSKSNVVLCTATNLEPVYTFPKPFDFSTSVKTNNSNYEPTIRYLPKHNLLVWMPDERRHEEGPENKIVIRDFDLKAELDKQRQPYLFVDSRPNEKLQYGSDFKYQARALTNAKSVKYSLDFGPPGIAVSKTGIVTLSSEQFPREITSVSLTATGDNGIASTQTFELYPTVKPIHRLAINSDGTESKSMSSLSQTGGIYSPPPKSASPYPAVAEVRLPEKFDKMCSGGAGKYMIFRLPKQNKLVVFDLENRTLAYNKAVPADALFAASKEKLIVASGDLGKLERFDLSSGKLEQSVPLGKMDPDLAVMGHGGTGPLLMWEKGKSPIEAHPVRLWDLETLKEIPARGRRLAASPRLKDFAVTVSPGGKVFFSKIDPYHSHHLMYVRGNSTRIQKTKKNFDNFGKWAMPINDGKKIFGNRKIFDQNLVEINIDRESVNAAGHVILPNFDDRFCISLKKEYRHPARLTLRTSHDLSEIVSTETLTKQCSKRGEWGRLGGVTRLRYFHDQKMLVSISDDNDRIVIRDFDFEQILKAQGVSYLFVPSIPPSKAILNQKYQNKIETSTSFSDLKFELLHSPDGMEIDAETGVITWTPKAFPESLAKVSAAVTAKDGTTRQLHFYIGVYSDVENTPDDEIEGAIRADDLPDKTDAPPRSQIGGTTHSPAPKPASSYPVVAEIDLPGKFDKMCSGGAGKYMIFRLPKQNSLAVFDLENRKLVYNKTVPPDALFAASREKLIVASGDHRTLERFDLSSGELEKSVPLRKIDPDLAVMGHGGTGPLLLWEKGKSPVEAQAVRLWDLETLKEIPGRGERLSTSYSLDKFAVAVSPDGKVFCGTTDAYYHSVMYVGPKSTYIRKSSKVDDKNGKWAVPFTDGKKLLGGGNVFDQNLVEVEINKESINAKGHAILPNFDDRFCISLSKERRGPARLTLRTSHDLSEIVSTDTVAKHCSDHVSWGRLGVVTRLRYFHDQKMLVSIPEDNDQIVIREFDFEQTLKDQGESYLFVISSPPSKVNLRQKYEHKIETCTSFSDLKFELLYAPDGMEIDAETGLITWTPKAIPERGRVKVFAAVTAKDGTKRTLHFDIAVYRDTQQLAENFADGSKSEKNFGFNQIDHLRVELPNRTTSFSFTPNEKVLLLGGLNLAKLSADGWSIEKSWELERNYLRVFERKQHYIGICAEPPGIYYLDKKTLKEVKAYPLTGRVPMDMVAHPTLPICYVTFNVKGHLPRNRFLVFDEEKMQGQENNEWFGNWLAISANGEQLYTGYRDTYRKGSELLMNPNRWHVVPSYGSLDWMVKYDLNKDGRPSLQAIKSEVGRGGVGVALSKDGSQITYLSTLGNGKNLSAFQTTNFDVIPVVFPLKDREATTKKLAYHPVLELAVALKTTDNPAPIFFDTKLAGARECLGEGDLEELYGVELTDLFFSPDGLHLIVEGTAQGISYLHKFELKLEPKELKAIDEFQKAKADF